MARHRLPTAPAEAGPEWRLERALDGLPGHLAFCEDARLGRYLRRLLDLHGEELLYLSREPDGYRLLVGRQRWQRSTLRAVLEAALAIPEARRVCKSCEQDKPLSAFSFLETGPERRNRYCRACEAQRVAAYEARLKEKRAAKEKEIGNSQQQNLPRWCQQGRLTSAWAALVRQLPAGSGAAR